MLSGDKTSLLSLLGFALVVVLAGTNVVVSIAQRTISHAKPARKLATLLRCVMEEGHYHLPFQHPTHREHELSLHCRLWPP